MTQPVVTASHCWLEFVDFGGRNGGGVGGVVVVAAGVGTGMSDSLFQLVLGGQTVCGCVHVMASH